jgi:hypothetical protein
VELSASPLSAVSFQLKKSAVNVRVGFVGLGEL